MPPVVFCLPVEDIAAAASGEFLQGGGPKVDQWNAPLKVAEVVSDDAPTQYQHAGEFT
ncbi:hypothetical protein ACFS07_35145 [Undibacterium arcticum]